MRVSIFFVSLMVLLTATPYLQGQATDVAGKPIEPLPKVLDFFPVAAQFSPVPSGEGWKGEEGPLSETTLRQTIDNMRAHGFTGLEGPTGRPPDEEAIILNYAQSCGMFITWHAGALENFGRDAPPVPCVYSAEYANAVRANAEKSLAPLKNIPRLYNVFTFQDEPFTGGPQSFGYNDEVKAEFLKRYGYDLPEDLESTRKDPKKWKDLMDFRTAKFPDGWRQTYPIIKSINPDFKATLTHDSHNTFGAGYGSHAVLAIDDVFHWGGDFADMFVFDLYPHQMDFRFGECAKLPLPRISQTHYTFAQMRALTRVYGKDLGFWVETYNSAWFEPFLGPEWQAMHWTEREMSLTAVAAGSNYLLTGYKIPVDTAHWEAFGQGLRLLQKTGGALLGTEKLKAKACMLFPRSHYIQMQEEYYNVGLSFELFLRAFGELDILHEEQVKDHTLDGYSMLVLFDVKLLPRETAGHIAEFVKQGGIVLADCVPQLDEERNPMSVMTELFGVSKAETGRILRTGHWIPYKTMEPVWFARPENAPDESVFQTDTLKKEAWDAVSAVSDITLVSPRGAIVNTAEVLARTEAGIPAIMHRQHGKGHAWLLGFCLQDTYFKTWQDDNADSREQLRSLLAAIPKAAGLRPHVYSSNADIEAALRANATEAFLFVINHESQNGKTAIELADIGFSIGKITDIEDNLPVAFEMDGGKAKVEVMAPLGEVRLFKLVP